MNPRDQLIDRAILATLQACGGYLLPEEQLFQETFLRAPKLLRSEFNDRRRALESRALILGASTEYGPKWRLTDEGKAHCSEHQI
jgi:hypothetical protein